MNETTKKYLAWLIVVVAILVAGYLGVVYPIPAPPTSPVVEPQALTSGGIKCHSVGPTGNCVEIWNGGDVRIYSNQGTTSKFAVDGATGDTTIAGSLAVSGSTVDGGVIGNNTAITGTLTVTGATALNGGLAMDTSAFSVADATGNTVISGTLNVTSTLSQGGVSFTGPIKYGTAATYTSGASISHGFATTPTVCILTPARDVTATLTITTTGFSSDTATRAAPIYWLCGK